MPLFIYLSRIFLALIIVFGIFALFLPELMSTDWARKQSLRAINTWIPGHLNVRTWQLHWGKPQILEGVALKDADGQFVLKVERLEIDTSLWSILTKQASIGKVRIQDMYANLFFQGLFWINLENALGFSRNLEMPIISPFELSQVNGEFQLFAIDQPFFIRVEGSTQQQDLKGSFNFFIQLNELHASNLRELKEKLSQYLEKEIQADTIQIDIQNFPTQLTDSFTSLKNERFHAFFQSFLGDRMSLIINKTHSDENLLLWIQAPLVEGGFKGHLHEGSFTLLEPATFHLDLTPEFISRLSQFKIQPQKQISAQVIFPNLSFPLTLLNQPESIDFCQCGFEIDAAISSSDVKVRPIGIVNIDHFEVQFASSIQDSQIHFKWTGYAEYFQKPLHINFEKWFKKPTNLAAFLKKPKLESVSAVVPASK